MKSYKELLNEMFKPLSGDQMLRIIQRKYPSAILQAGRFNDTTNTIAIPCADDDNAYEEFFSRDEKANELNKKKLDDMLRPYHWYVNQTNDRRKAIVIQQRDIHDVNSTTTYDPSNYIDTDKDELLSNEADIREYGFIHVTPIAPSILQRTGLRAKSSGTFDKHDEKRIYLFSLAPQFITNRENLSNELSSGSNGLEKLATVMSDEGTPLSLLICSFVEARNNYFKDEEDKIKYVYFIKKLQKPAKLYKDNAWTDIYSLDALYTKDYNIMPQDVVYLGTIEELEEATKQEISNSNLSTSRRSTSIGEVDASEPIDQHDVAQLTNMYNDDICTRRVINLATNLLKSQYSIEMTPQEVIKKASRIVDYLDRVMFQLAFKLKFIEMDGDLSDMTKRQFARRLYATVADPIVATVLADIDYGKVRTQR